MSLVVPDQHELVGELLDRQADRMLRVVEDDGHATVDGRGHVARARDLS